MRSLTTDSYRCYSTSILMQDSNYLVSVTCRNLKYPADNSILYYILWATPTNESPPIKLAELGLGRISVKTKIPFKNLFVTIENDPKAKYPTGKMVMKGDIEPISFLEPNIKESVTPTNVNLNLTNTETYSAQNQEQVTKEKSNPKEKLFSAMQRASIVAAIVLVILVGIIFAVSKAKG
ncbi:MAG: hypothetical protein N2558_02950 [Patescibacteria group bacterium]|nr:hypothetical protein [Patescibacteria group bacterium]